MARGDITRIPVDAIVNAANNQLRGGGGVDGAIHQAAGPVILEECRRIVERRGICKTGEAVYTSAGKLPAKWIIHTVGPVYQNEPNSRSLLLNCYQNSLSLAETLQVQSISFPNISTGVYGYPKGEAANIALNYIHEYRQSGKLKKIILVCHDLENYQIYDTIMNKW